MLASMFDTFFGGRDTFFNLNAIKTLWSLSCILGVLFLAVGVVRFRRSRDPHALLSVVMRALICGSLMLPFCKLAEKIKTEAQSVKASTGFTPEEINKSLTRIARKANEAKEANSGTSTASWYEISEKAADSIGRVVVTLILSGVLAVAWVIKLALKLFYLAHDFIFYSSLLIAPLAFGLTGSSFFDTRRGMSFIMTVVGVSIWPFCWLFVDAVVLMTLKPLDPQIGGSSVLQSDAKLYAPLILEGIGGFTTLLILLVVVAVLICLGYVASIRLAHRVFGSIGGGIMEMGANLFKGAASTAARATVAVATGGTLLPAGVALGGAGAPVASGAGSSLAARATSLRPPAFQTVATSSSGGGSDPFTVKPRSAGQLFSTLKGSVPSTPQPHTSNWRTNRRIEAENEAAQA
jgi:hypothetical protein